MDHPYERAARICSILLQDLIKTRVCCCEVEMLLHITLGSSEAVCSLAKFPFYSEFTNEKIENEVIFFGVSIVRKKSKKSPNLCIWFLVHSQRSKWMFRDLSFISGL
jgi:hypothetical protein